MNDLERRWRRLVAASRNTAPPDPPPPSPAFVERVARRGLAGRVTGDRRGDARQPEPWAWTALFTTASIGALLLFWAGAPAQHEAAALAEEFARLPTHVPAAPDLPAPFSLPPAREALALFPDGPALRSALGLPPISKDTP
jgi:hypothetical protein